MRNLVVDGLVAKRAELTGIIAELERQLAQHRANLTHIDGVLRVLDASVDLETMVKCACYIIPRNRVFCAWISPYREKRRPYFNALGRKFANLAEQWIF